jgi:hypothetical protein
MLNFLKRFRRAKVTLETDQGTVNLEGSEAFVERALSVYLKSQPPGRSPGVSSFTPIHEVPRFRAKPGPRKVDVEAIDGPIGKTYKVEAARLRATPLGRVLNFDNFKKIYVEHPRLVSKLVGNERTLWHKVYPESRRNLLEH